MRTLTVSTLYPNNIDFKHGVFVETRLRHLVKHFPEIEPTVIAPVPWFPFKAACFGNYGKYAQVEKKEQRHGIEIHHPRYLVIPKVGMYLTPLFMAWSIRRCIRGLMRQGKRFDLIDGHYFFPDGVAILRVAESLGMPFTCTARGTDISLLPQFPRALQMIRRVFSKAAHTMSVCAALKDEMVAIGAAENNVTVLRNGVDLDLFAFVDEARQQQLRAKYADTPVLISSVGRLVELKGHGLIIQALTELPGATLCIAGDGPEKTALLDLAKRLGVSDRVRLLGPLPQPALRELYQASDVSILASSREGWANVLLESMACGTPVVATRVWGTPEVVSNAAAGQLVERSVTAITEGVKTLLANKPSRLETRRYAEQFDWHSTSEGQYRIFKDIANR